MGCQGSLVLVTVLVLGLASPTAVGCLCSLECVSYICAYCVAMYTCECGFEYDGRKKKCPQCAVPYKGTKAELDAEEDPLLGTPSKQDPAKQLPVEPESPSMDRQASLMAKLALAEEKQTLLKQKEEMRKLEDRLSEIDAENEAIERRLATPGHRTQPPGRVPAPAQNGGASGVNTEGGFQSTRTTPLLFYADGSPFDTGDNPALASSTLQAGLQSVGLGLQALGLGGGAGSSLPTAGEHSLLGGGGWMGEPVRRKRSRHWIRPDYHLPYDKGYEDMTYRELIYGMVSVLQCIFKANDPRFSPEGYLEHFKYIALKEIRPTYINKAVAKYDFDVTSKVAAGHTCFAAAEHKRNREIMLEPEPQEDSSLSFATAEHKMNRETMLEPVPQEGSSLSPLSFAAVEHKTNHENMNEPAPGGIFFV